MDNFVIFRKIKVECGKILKVLNSKFDLKVLGVTKKLFGINFEYGGNNILLNQSKYIDDIYNRFSNFHIPLTSVPIPKGLKFSKLDCPTNGKAQLEMSKFPYRNIIGYLSFLARQTRPDTTYVFTYVFSQFQ